MYVSVCLFICVHMCSCTFVQAYIWMYVCPFICVRICDFLFPCLSQSQHTALHWASEGGHHEIVQLLIEGKADVNRLDLVRVVYI